MVTFAEVEAARLAMEAAKDRVDREYWAFTRQARGKPVSGEAQAALVAAVNRFMVLQTEWLREPWVPTGGCDE